MFKDKSQLKKDLLLIGIFVTIVLGLILFFVLTRTKGDAAIIKYENTTLFEVDMETGKFTSHTEIFELDQLLDINDEQEINKLELGKGVLVFDNNYYILGKLGVVHVEYNYTNKMIRVVKETSPYNICSSQGYSNNAPIICLPNLVFITFSDSEVDEIIG